MENKAKQTVEDILHFVIACRQETQLLIKEKAERHHGHPHISRWRVCVDKIIGGIKNWDNMELGKNNEFVCYHITTKDRLPSILKEGLKPSSKPNWFTRNTPYILLSKYPYWTLYENAVLIEIKHPEILPSFFDDPEGLRWGEIIPPEYFNAIIDFKPIDIKHRSQGER